MPPPLDYRTWGSGPRVILVHGSILNGPLTWAEQRPLANRWQLEVLNRRGYGNSLPPSTSSDFEEDAIDVAAHLGDGAHLVGTSYGALASFFAATIRPEAVRSLTLIEPLAFGTALPHPAAVQALEDRKAVVRDKGLREFMISFGRAVRGPDAPPPVPLPDPYPPDLEQGIRTTMTQREPGPTKLPTEKLRETPFPKLVVSGGHHPAYEVVCDVLQQQLNAERQVIKGAGHQVQRVGAAFNECLNAFLERANQQHQ